MAVWMSGFNGKVYQLPLFVVDNNNEDKDNKHNHNEDNHNKQ